jgi:hypothetical protein
MARGSFIATVGTQTNPRPSESLHGDYVGDFEMEVKGSGFRVRRAIGDQLARSSHDPLVAAVSIVDGIWSNAFLGARINVLKSWLRHSVPKIVSSIMTRFVGICPGSWQYWDENCQGVYTRFRSRTINAWVQSSRRAKKLSHTPAETTLPARAGVVCARANRRRNRKWRLRVISTRGRQTGPVIRCLIKRCQRRFDRL